MKNILLCALLLSSVAVLSAQRSLSVQLSYSPSFSLTQERQKDNLGQLTFCNQVDFQLVYQLTERVGLVAGAGMASVNQRLPYPDVRTVQEAIYLRVPLLLNLQFPVGERQRFFIRVGPHFDYLVGATDITEGPTTFTDDQGNDLGTYPQKQTQDAQNRYSSFNLGATLEIGNAWQLSENLSFVSALHLTSSITQPGVPEFLILSPPDPAQDNRRTWGGAFGLKFGLSYRLT